MQEGHLKVSSGDFHQISIGWIQALVDGGVGSLTEQHDSLVALQDHRHSLAHIVEIEDAEQLVDTCFSLDLNGDGVRGAAL